MTRVNNVVAIMAFFISTPHLNRMNPSRKNPISMPGPVQFYRGLGLKLVSKGGSVLHFLHFGGGGAEIII